MDRQTTDDRQSEKLTWAFSSGEVKILTMQLNIEMINSITGVYKFINCIVILLWPRHVRSAYSKFTVRIHPSYLQCRNGKCLLLIDGLYNYFCWDEIILQMVMSLSPRKLLGYHTWSFLYICFTFKMVVFKLEGLPSSLRYNTTLGPHNDMYM